MKITERDLLDLIHWARRYVDRRLTGVASEFNEVYKRVIEENPTLKLIEVKGSRYDDSHVVPTFPLAKDRGVSEK